jgi:hypothetical protein
VSALHRIRRWCGGKIRREGGLGRKCVKADELGSTQRSLLYSQIKSLFSLLLASILIAFRIQFQVSLGLMLLLCSFVKWSSLLCVSFVQIVLSKVCIVSVLRNAWKKKENGGADYRRIYIFLTCRSRDLLYLPLRQSDSTKRKIQIFVTSSATILIQYTHLISIRNICDSI